MVAAVFKWFFKFTGWKLYGSIAPEIKKCIILGVPHTSNWDFVYGFGALECFKIKLHFMAKKELFRFPLKSMFENFGGIPINRKSPKNTVVDVMIDAFNSRDELKLAIAPEGTRKRVDKWKSGFYHLALGAKVPVVLGFVDYKRKLAGFGPTLYMTGNIAEDMAIISNFYKDISARVPDKFNIDGVRIIINNDWILHH